MRGREREKERKRGGEREREIDGDSDHQRGGVMRTAENEVQEEQGKQKKSGRTAERNRKRTTKNMASMSISVFS